MALLGLLALLEKPFEMGAEKIHMSSSYFDTGHAHIYSVKVERDNKDIFKFQDVDQNTNTYINTLAGVVKMIYKRQCTEDDDCLGFIKNKKTVMEISFSSPGFCDHDNRKERDNLYFVSKDFLISLKIIFSACSLNIVAPASS